MQFGSLALVRRVAEPFERGVFTRSNAASSWVRLATVA